MQVLDQLVNKVVFFIASQVERCILVLRLAECGVAETAAIQHDSFLSRMAVFKIESYKLIVVDVASEHFSWTHVFFKTVAEALERVCVRRDGSRRAGQRQTTVVQFSSPLVLKLKFLEIAISATNHF
jgi:hypothetical protein